MHWITMVIFIIGLLNAAFKLISSDTDRTTVVYASASTTFVDCTCRIFQHHSGHTIEGPYPCLPLAAGVGNRPAYADGGAANIFSYSQEFLGILYGPGTGDLFYSAYLGQYVLMFQADDPAIDRNVYVSYSAALDRGWSTPQAIYQTSTLPGGYSYSFHAYANYDSSGRVIPLSWSEYAPPNTYIISMASLTFA
ncbi:hypothetical protein V8F06_011050 [Rhypophila decipiens]